MLIQELYDLASAVCPIVVLHGDGSAQFDQSATPAQKTAAQAIIASAKLNGLPQQIPLAYTTTYAQVQALYGSNQLLALHYLMAWVSWLAVNNPQAAADINSKLGTSIGFQQANPLG